MQPSGKITVAALAATGALHIVRLARWAGDRTWRDRLVLIRHVGYGFVPLGFLLAAAAAIDLVPADTGTHAWMVAAAGTMTLAVMTRESLGHTERFSADAGNLCGSRHCCARAHLLIAGTGLERPIAACRGLRCR